MYLYHFRVIRKSMNFIEIQSCTPGMYTDVFKSCTSNSYMYKISRVTHFSERRQISDV